MVGCSFSFSWSSRLSRSSWSSGSSYFSSLMASNGTSKYWLGFPLWSPILAYKFSLVPSELPTNESSSIRALIPCDTLLSSLIDSNVSLKWKIMEEYKVGACSLACNTLGVEGASWSSGMGTRKNDKQFNHSHKPAQNQTTSWLVLSWSTFGTRTNHEQTRTHKIHHGLDLKEATFPLIVYFVPGHGTDIQMAFCPETPKWESRNSQSWDSRNFASHNFVCRPLIEMRSKPKL